MKLLLVASMPPQTSSTFINAQIKYLKPDTVLHSGFRPFLYNNKSIFGFPLSINFLRILIKRLIPPLYSYLYTNTLENFIREKNFEIVLCNYGLQGANIAKACSQAKVPLVVHFLGYDAYIRSVLQEYKKQYTFLFGNAYRVVVVSHDMADQLKALGCPPDKIIEIPCGFDTKFFKPVDPLSSNKQLLFVGRFTEKKAPGVLISAFHFVLQHVPDARLIMIGTGELYLNVVLQIEKLGISNSIELLGIKSPEEVMAEMGKARAYVQHSRVSENGDSEGSPVSIIEAAGCGLPVISTKHAGIKESVIHGKTGYLVEEGDWKKMGEYMIMLLNDPELAYQLGKEGRNHILQNFNMEKQMKELLGLLKSATTQNFRHPQND
jgi:colanic acid/amylovoran biosynthesis glycosyltransferase